MLPKIRSERGFLKPPPGVVQYLAYGFLTFLIFGKHLRALCCWKGVVINVILLELLFCAGRGGRSCCLSAVILPVLFCLIDGYTQTPFYERFLCGLLHCPQIWQRCFSKSRNRSRGLRNLFLFFTLCFVATRHFLVGAIKSQQRAPGEQRSVQDSTYPGTIFQLCGSRNVGQFCRIVFWTFWMHTENKTNIASS